MARWELAVGHYVKTRAFYEEHLPALRAAGVRKATFVAGSHVSMPSFPRSSLYLDTVRDFFYHQGIEVSYRIGGTPDDDIIFMARARHFVQSGGGFSAMAAEMCRRTGGTVLCSGADFSCDIDGSSHG